MAGWTERIGSRRSVAGFGLMLGGVAVLGLWAVLGWGVPVLLLGLAIVLAWKRSAVGVGAAVLGAGLLFWLGLAFGWIAWTVGLALLAAGAGLLIAGGRHELESGTGSP